MSRVTKVEFLYDFGSPNAYLAHEAIPVVAARVGLEFEYVPVLLGGVFKATGNVSPAVSTQGIKNKGEYLMREVARFVRRHGIAHFNFNPFFPVNTLQIMRGAVVAQREGIAAEYIDAVFAHTWGEAPKKMDDADVIRAALEESGLPAERIMAGIADSSVKQQLIENTQRAVERGVFGMPAFFVGTEQYFGKEAFAEIEQDLARGFAREGAG